MKKQFAGLLEVHHVRRMFEPEEALGRRPQLCEPGGGNLGRRLKVAPTRHEENRTVKPRHIAIIRSEEHTSELQSLMRISYAVFCLKKKKKKTQQTTNTQQNERT